MLVLDQKLKEMDDPIKLTYFNVSALGEPIRLLLAYMGKKFEDERISVYSWADHKQNYLFGQLPVYEENGRVVNQSVAIMRYLGKKCKLAGNNDWENLEIDAIADTVKDLICKSVAAHYEPSAKHQAKLRQIFTNETLPFYTEKLEKIAKENGGHLALKRLTWIDFYWAGTMGYFLSMPMIKVNVRENNPNLKSVRENVFNLSAIKKWHEKNPIPKEAEKEWLEFSEKATLP